MTRTSAPAVGPVASDAETLAALSPWQFHPQTATAAHLSEAVAAAEAGSDLEELAARVAGVSALRGLDGPPDDPAEPVHQVAVHLARTRARVAAAADLGLDPVAELRRVVSGYDYQLAAHRWVLGADLTLADVLLWRAVIALPVRLGEDAAADVLRGLPAIRAWAGRLAAAEPAVVAVVGEDVLLAHRRGAERRAA